MLLTQQKRLPRDPDHFPTAQLLLLALVRVAEPIALTSIFPYAWKLVLHFQIGDESNAAFFAGILISAFSLAEALTGMYWGGLSDRIGRKPVLLLGCAGTLLSLLVVGFSSNFWMALAGRLLGGALNGNIGVIQTMVGELVTKPEHEPRAFAIMPFVWSIGTIIGPSIGGYFAEPRENLPEVVSPTSVFAVFPYLLPNVVCAVLLLGSIAAGYLFLDETHPDMQPWSTQADLDNTTAETPLMPTAAAPAHAAADLRSESYGTFNAVNVEEEQNWHVKPDGRSLSVSSRSSDPKATVFGKPVLMLVAALGIFTYHTMSYDHLLPIFLQDKRINVMAASLTGAPAGGLGLTTKQVGLIMSVNGIIALLVQAVIFPLMATWLGVWKLFVCVTVGHPTAYFVVPFLAGLPSKYMYAAIYACLALRNFFSILSYPLLLILIKEAAPDPTHLGKINGLAASTGAACRTLASPVAGLLYSVGVKLDFTALAWWFSGLVAIIGALQVPLLPRQKNKTAHVRAVGGCRLVPSETKKAEVVHITVEAVDEEEDDAYRFQQV